MQAIFRNLIALFFATSLLIPTLLINKGLFVIIVLLMFFSVKPGNRIVFRNTYSPVIIFSIFLFGYFVSFLSYTDRAVSNQFLLAVLVLILIYPIQNYKIDIDKIVKICGILMCLYTAILLMIIFYLPGSFLIEPAMFLISDASGGSFGMRSVTGEEKASFGLHLGTVPFLYLPFVLYFHSFLKKRSIADLLAILLLTVFIIISTSRGLWAICAFGALIVLFLKLKSRGRILLISILVPAILVAYQYLATNTEAISPEETSNSVKIGHIESFFDNLNFTNFFIGDGLGAYYYSKGASVNKSNTEITPLDMARYFGVILTLVLYIVIILPSGRLYMYKNKILFISIFVLYVLNSFSNPTMFNSYGLLIVLWYWYKILSGDDKSGKLETQISSI